MLKLLSAVDFLTTEYQPPLGGCVLKLPKKVGSGFWAFPAAFRRLCVETKHLIEAQDKPKAIQPPLGGCVLKQSIRTTAVSKLEASRL